MRTANDVVGDTGIQRTAPPNSPPLVRSEPTNRIAWLAALLLTVAYVAVFAHFSSTLPLQDYPNHLARAVVMADLLFHHGANFGGVFEYHFLAVPYVLGDLALAAAIGLFGITGAAALWNAVMVLSFPAALLFYLRTLDLSAAARALAAILSLYLTTDWFLAKGFIAFRLAVAMTLLGLALARRLRQRQSAAVYGAYACVIALGYLVHLTVTVFEAVAVGVTGLLGLVMRKTSLGREIAILLPIAAALAWQLGIAGHYQRATDVPSDYYFWGTLATKLRDFDVQFMRYSPRIDLLMLATLGACVLWPAARNCRAARLKQPVVLETLALSATFVALYFVLPVAYADAWYVDARAAEFAILFLIVACLALPGEDAASGTVGRSVAVPLAILLAAGNLAYLTKHFAADSAWLGTYRQIIASLPRRASVLPIYTRAPEGSVRPLLHAAAHAVIDREANIPYLFSGNGGYPMKYFRYVRTPYAPDEMWYNTRGPVDWRAVGCDYDYLLVMKPFEPRRIALPTATVAENTAAALLAIGKAPCQAAPYP
jgi:hypothetical protein